MRVKKYLALLFAAILATTMLTGCPWDIENDAASDSSSAPSSSSRPNHDSSDDGSGSAPSSPSDPEQPSDDEESGEPENPGDEESGEPENPGDEEPTPTDIIEKYGTVKGDTLTLTTGKLYNDFRNALNNAPTIKKIVFDARVTFIPNSAFYKCTNLTNVELDDVTEIGSNAFQGCSSLISIDLGSVTSIGSHAFDSCTNLAHIRLGEGNQDGVDPNAFNGIAKTVHVYYGTSKEEAQAKWEELDLTMASGTQVEYHPDSEWDKRENNDNATEALPDAMKDLLALAERLD